MIHKAKKALKAKHKRIQAWTDMMGRRSKEGTVQQRKDTGGYRCPGSNKRT
jgi:hypothetical protein